MSRNYYDPETNPDPWLPVAPFWYYCFVKGWRQWAYIAGLWLLVGLGWAGYLLPGGWMLVSILAWSYVVWLVPHYWFLHKRRQRRWRLVEYRHEARMVQIAREIKKMDAQRANAPWN